MMKRLFGGLIAVGLAVLCGCASRHAARCEDRAPPHRSREGVCRETRRPSKNVLFGGSRDEIFLAQTYAGRSSWPFVETGSVLEDVTYFYEDRNDRQTFYDRFGGGTRQETQSYRTGVWVR